MVVIMPVRFALECLVRFHFIWHAWDAVRSKQVCFAVCFDRLDHFGKYLLRISQYIERCVVDDLLLQRGVELVQAEVCQP